MSLRRIETDLWLTAGAIAAVGIVLLIALVSVTRLPSDSELDRAALRAVGHACVPGHVQGVRRHNSGWRNGPYYEVHCSDGGMRLIPGGPR